MLRAAKLSATQVSEVCIPMYFPLKSRKQLENEIATKSCRLWMASGYSNEWNFSYLPMTKCAYEVENDKTLACDTLLKSS